MATINPVIREKILLELLNTERTYVNDLKIIKEVYMNPLKESGIITPDQQKTLFANVEEIEELNRTQVLARLEDRFKTAQENNLPAWQIQLGDIFQEMSVHLKHYTEYCSNQPGALAMLDELEKANSEFAAFTKNLMDTDNVVRGLSLLSFIIKPVQRLCKYPLLLRELINNSDPNDTQDYTQLQAATKKVSKTVEFVNAMKRHADNRAQEKLDHLAQVGASIQGAEVLDLTSDKNRSLTRTGDVNRIVKKKGGLRVLYLFNNLIVLASPKNKPNKVHTHKLDWFAKIIDVNVTDLGDDAANNIENGFELKSKSFQQTKVDEAVTICCPTANEKRAWIKDIRTHIKDWQSREAKRRQNVLRANSVANLRSGSISSASSGLIASGSRGSAGSSTAKSLLNQKRKPQPKKLGAQKLPDPPPDDGTDGWKQQQEDEKNNLTPWGTIIPESRWNVWLQYYDEEYGIPFYYNISTKMSTWVRPEGYATSVQ